MRNLKTLTALLCQPLLVHPGDAAFSHIAICLSSKSLSGAYRIAIDSYTHTGIFFLSQDECIGSSLSVNNDDTDPPALLSWKTLDEFKSLHQDRLPPIETSWKMLLDPFEKVELIQAEDAIDLTQISGEKLSRSEFLDKFFLEPD